MLGQRQEINLQVHQFVDSMLLVFAFWLTHTLRWHATEWFDIPAIRPFHQLAWILVIVAPFAPVALEINGFYRNVHQKTFLQSLRQFAQAFVWLLLAIGACVIFFKWAADSRAVVIGFILLGGGLILGKEAIVKARRRRQLASGALRLRVILAGDAADMDRAWNRLPALERQQMEVVARVDLSSQPVETLSQLFRKHNVERVLLAAEHIHFHHIEQAVRACEIEGVEAWLSTEFLHTERARPGFDVLGGQPMLVFRMTPTDAWALLAKEALDRILGLVILILSLPLWIVAYIGIKLSSPGPVLFCQERGGRYGRPFRMYKFRTMVVNAEELREKLAARNEMNGPAFKIQGDPRIFPFGAFLRKFSIDEFPQLINILRGEMSLVGPRPLPVYEVEKIEQSAQRRRLSVKPGLTCLWQVSGRSEITDFEEWVQLDLQYIDNWTFWLDVKILFRTIRVVLTGSGAR